MATAWRWTDVRTVDFDLRQARFHDGALLSPEDVVYSLNRARVSAAFMTGLRAVDVVTPTPTGGVRISLARPDPMLLEALADVPVVSKRWAAEIRLPTKPGPAPAAIAQANGTGPFRLESYRPGLETVLQRRDAWWGRPAPALSRVIITPIDSDHTRSATLLSGAADLVDAVPLQDLTLLRESGRSDIRVATRPGVLTLFLGLNTGRDKLSAAPGPSVPNPMRDRRVRAALREAIDVPVLAQRILRGLTHPHDQFVAPGVAGYVESDAKGGQEGSRRKSAEQARIMLAEAGFPDGFRLRLDCTNDRYLADEEICTALVAMLARSGIAIALNVQSKNKVMPLLYDGRSDFYLLGLIPFTLDGFAVAEALFGSRDIPGRGVLNVGQYHSETLDAHLDRALAALDRAKRDEAVAAALHHARDDVAAIPLFTVPVLWAYRAWLEVPQPATGRVHLERVIVRD
ncbi:MAG TPA: ABC transporter substrate-binding protein [Microvirga sp.]|nr:ABC transporter substrate-binding protein [Microvirga sp.]